MNKVQVNYITIASLKQNWILKLISVPFSSSPCKHKSFCLPVKRLLGLKFLLNLSAIKNFVVWNYVFAHSFQNLLNSSMISNAVDQLIRIIKKVF